MSQSFSITYSLLKSVKALLQYISKKYNVTQIICIWKLLYMFRVVSPPIIRSTHNTVSTAFVKPLLLPALIVEELERHTGYADSLRAGAFAPARKLSA